MKKFEFPEINVISFEIADVITSSNELPVQPFSMITDEFDIYPIE